MARKGGAPENMAPKWKPGESGNPKGRPKGSKNVSTLVKELLEKVAPEDVSNAKFVKEFVKTKKPTVKDALAARMIYNAIIVGDGRAIRELLDRTEGKVLQKSEITGADGQPIETSTILVQGVPGTIRKTKPTKKAVKKAVKTNGNLKNGTKRQRIKK